MIPSLNIFLEKMYWIDISVILIVVWVFYFFILIRAHWISKKNKTHNIELYTMRAEIYTEYEKNFFL
jgi:hypothetical protein